jgi:hypothetical protein
MFQKMQLLDDIIDLLFLKIKIAESLIETEMKLEYE